MITDSKCADTRAMMLGKRVARFANFETVAMRKLVQLNAATTLDFLRIPPGNRLEALKGSRLGQHSIRLTSSPTLAFGHRLRGKVGDSCCATQSHALT